EKSSLNGMTEVHDVGRRYVDVFSDGVNTVSQPSTEAAYKSLDEFGARVPTYTASVSTMAYVGQASANFVGLLLNSLMGVKTAYAAIAYDTAQSYTACVTGTSCTYA